MAEPSHKRRKLSPSSKSNFRSSAAAQAKPITDPRFASLQSDPRYRLPSKRTTHVQLDKRFARVLKDDDFSRKAKVDRYGRPLENDAERKRLKRRYEFEEEEGDEPGVAGAGEADVDEGDSVDDDEEVQEELRRIERGHDPLREGRAGSTSSSLSSEESSSSEEDEDELQEDLETTMPAPNDTGIPVGEVTSRIAVVNLDWDNIRAPDLMAVFSSFLPSTGRLLKVSIYPSEFGKERMEREEMEGPPKELFAATNQRHRAQDEMSDSDGAQSNINARTDDDDEEDEEAVKSSLLNADSGEPADFNSTALRNYQLSRLRYFYAVLTFSSPQTARHIYDVCDGTEYLSSANFFDLRFVPDDTDFSSDTLREECESIPAGYRPNDFVTDALQHSRVRLTWDAEDEEKRREVAARAFRMGKEKKRGNVDESDLQAYLGSSSSSDDDDLDDNDSGIIPTMETGAGETEQRPQPSKKETERQRLRALLGLAPEPVKSKAEQKSNRPVGDLQITFSAGLSAADKTGKAVFENEPYEAQETTVEKYVRKERERKARRREKLKANAGVGGDVDVEQEKGGGEDLGFDDPFFVEPDSQPQASKTRKEERRRRREEREREDDLDKKEREELILLMDDDDDDRNQNTGTGQVGMGGQHFNMAEIVRAEKRKKKHDEKTPKEGTRASGVEMDDPRFAHMYSNPEFAIDPTNPKFRDTVGMRGLLEQGRRRRRGAEDGEDGGDGGKREGKGGGDDVSKLIARTKARIK